MRLIAVLALGGVILAGGVPVGAAGTNEAEKPASASAPDVDATDDRAAGRVLAGQCRTCHGLDGMAQIPIAPHIGGEPVDYIIHQLTAFRDGTREHEMMSIVARSLSDQQIRDLAAWYSGHSVTVTPAADPAAAPEACLACHGTDGLAQIPDAPNLAGETNIYIDTQLKAFRSGKRVHDIMTPIAQGMTDADIRAVADWYSAVKIKIELAE